MDTHILLTFVVVVVVVVSFSANASISELQPHRSIMLPNGHIFALTRLFNNGFDSKPGVGRADNFLRFRDSVVVRKLGMVIVEFGAILAFLLVAHYFLLPPWANRGLYGAARLLDPYFVLGKPHVFHSHEPAPYSLVGSIALLSLYPTGSSWI